LLIFKPSLLMLCSRAWEGERDAPLGRLQARCQRMIAPAGRILREKFSSRPENPHGFELSRTLSCNPAPRDP
jgi:hypothetical protein